MIYSLSVSFGSYNPDLGMADDFMFCDELEKVFVPFRIDCNGKNKMNQLMTEWEHFKSDTTTYFQDSLLHPGCYRNFATAEP